MWCHSPGSSKGLGGMGVGQRAGILTEILGFDGWKVTDTFFESAAGERVRPVRGFALIRDTRLVLSVERRWLPRCSKCGGPCHDVHERRPPPPWAEPSRGGGPAGPRGGPARG